MTSCRPQALLTPVPRSRVPFSSQLSIEIKTDLSGTNPSLFSTTVFIMGDRSRSRSPYRRDDDRPRAKKSGGFRWKEKRRDDDTRGEDRQLDRGYRTRDERPRSPRRDRDSDRYGDRRRDDQDRRRDDRDAPREDRAEKTDKKDKKEKKKKKPVVPQSSEPMIVVYVNDRLGTKAEIPCLASDPISTSPLVLREALVELRGIVRKILI